MCEEFVRKSTALSSFVDHTSRPLVRPQLNRTRPFQAYGVTSFVPMIACKFAIVGQPTAASHAAMCSLNAAVRFASALPMKRRQGPLKMPKVTSGEASR